MLPGEGALPYVYHRSILVMIFNCRGLFCSLGVLRLIFCFPFTDFKCCAVMSAGIGSNPSTEDEKCDDDAMHRSLRWVSGTESSSHGFSGPAKDFRGDWLAGFHDMPVLATCTATVEAVDRRFIKRRRGCTPF